MITTMMMAAINSGGVSADKSFIRVPNPFPASWPSYRRWAGELALQGSLVRLSLPARAASGARRRNKLQLAE